MNNLFSPKSVAVVGASANPNKWGNWAAEQVAAHKHLRNVYLINPRGEIIYGIQSLASISEIPESLDVAIVTVPLVAFEETIDQLLKHGTKVIVGITTGFGERNKEGAELERRVVNKVTKAGSILIGPNCAGILDNHSSFHCLPVLCPERAQAPGTIGLISQSGGLVTDVHIRLEEIGMNFSRVASIGNCSGVSLTDLLDCFEKDPNTKIIAMYLEDDDIVPYNLIEKVTKPVVVMMPHHTKASVKAARKHTNSKLKGAPIDYVDNVRDLIATIQAANSKQHRAGERVMIVTDTGGMGIQAAAEAEHNFLTMTRLRSKTLKLLENELKILPQAVLSNPLDMISIPSGFSEATIRAMKVLQHAPEVDAIIMILFLIEAKFKDEYETGVELAKLARAGGKPVVFVCKTYDSPGARALLEENMPVYRDIDTAVHMVEFLCG